MTNQNLTFSILNSYFLNTATNNININYLNENIMYIFDIQYRNECEKNGKSRLHNLLVNFRRPIHSLIWEAFIVFTNLAIQQEYEEYTCTSGQLKKYLKSYGLDYSIFEATERELSEWRTKELNK